MPCATSRIVVDIVLALFNFLGSILILRLIYRFVKERSKEAGNKALYRVSIAFFMSIVISVFVGGLGFIFWCPMSSISRLCIGIGKLCYIVQYLLLFWLLFYRLDVIFRGSGFEVSRYTKRVFYISYIMTLVLALLLVVMFVNALYTTIFGIVVMICFFISVMIFIVMLIAPFINKISAVSKSANNDGLMPIVTKTFILTFASIISVIILAILIIINAINGYTSFSLLVEGLVSLADQITNYLSIFWGFNTFTKEYMKMCGCCHTNCTKCWLKGNKSNVDKAPPMAKTLSVSTSQVESSGVDTQNETVTTI